MTNWLIEVKLKYSGNGSVSKEESVSSNHNKIFDLCPNVLVGFSLM
jgi:uncharacterized protein YbbK (DUF523 family)